METFTSEDRKRFTSTALEATSNLKRIWGLSDEEASTLFGMPAEREAEKEGNGATTLTDDQLTRMSILIGIFKGLHTLWTDDEMTARWIRSHNTGPLFSNRTPIEVMLTGGIPMMKDVRGHIDAVIEGL